MPRPDQDRPISSFLRPTALAALLAACGGQDAPTSTDPSAPAGGDDPLAAAETGGCILSTDLPGGDVATAPRAADPVFPWQLDSGGVTRVEGFDEADIISGGPPPDGIRPIEHDEACFESVAAADQWLPDDAPVMVVEVAGEVRAYPVGILTQHEIVNDVIAGVPVVVTYCPLCNSGLAFERTVDGEVLSFGTSGRLFQSNLVMYDRQHTNLWTQFTGKAVVGKVGDDLTGTELDRLPTSLLGWAELREVAPDALVLSREVDPSRDYTRNPYPGYDDIGIGYGPFRGDRDERLPPNTRVVGLGTDSDPVAIPLPVLQEAGVVEVDVDGERVSVWWAPGASSALDQRTVFGGRDVGQTLSVVARGQDGTALTFAPSDDDPTRFVDEQTGSTWDLLGRAVDGPLAGEQLEVVARDDTFWFVWFAFQPTTRLADA